MTALPQPGRERWQPVRAGLVDLFYYDQEEFRFSDGRLLLRGNNGTGKSKVLALMLPFLLDGELSPNRVEPDADRNKRMEWNLLLGGEHPTEDRLGYTWLEFGRRDTGGRALFCTLGCGLKAVKGRGVAQHWFFITEQRVGEALTLVDGTGTALGRDRLEAEIGAAGVVHRTARDYRRAVDQKLFHLGDQRYGALLELLIKIRAPQLSKRPSERALSDALTGALPPLDQALISDVAEAFRGLEEDRDALAAMVEARDASLRYLDTYRGYAQIAARRRAAPLRQAQSVLDRVSRELADAQAAHKRALGELEAAEATLARLRADEDRLRACDQALRESPEMRSARELERAADEARRAAELAADARGAVDRAVNRLAERSERLSQAEARQATADSALAQARKAALEHARSARVETAFARDVEDALDATEYGELRRRSAELADRQQRAVDHVRTLLGAAAECRRALAVAREQRERLASEEAVVTERREMAVQELAAIGGELVSRAREQLAAATELTVDDPGEALGALEVWVETLDGPNPLEAAVDVAGRRASAELGRADAELEARTTDTTQLARELDASIARLEAGEHESPLPPYTRDPASRAQRAGAPLWQVVDFREDVPASQRAGIEAALEAAGILDAWVSPDGELLAPGTHDVLLKPDQSPAPSRAGLHTLLEPAIDREDPCTASVQDEAVQRVLATIGVADRDFPVWVAPDGAFRNGVLAGAWSKSAAAFIGHGAREAARRARLAELGRQREIVSGLLAELEQSRVQLGERRARLEAELEQMPDDEALRSAHGMLARVEAELAKLAQQTAAAQMRMRDAQAEMEAAALELRSTADELRLPESGPELENVLAGLHAFRVALAELWPALEVRDRAREATDQGRADVDSMDAELTEHSERLELAVREHAMCAERHGTLARTAGAAIAELQRQLEEVATGLRDNDRRHDEADGHRSQAQHDLGRADALCQQLQRGLEQATEHRIAAIDGLRRFASTGLIDVALDAIELPGDAEEWGVTTSLRIARQLEQELADVDSENSAWQRAQRRVTDEHGALADALRRHGNNASASMREEGITVEILFRGRSTSVPTLARSLSEEVADRQRLLDEREREILENHLIGEVASTLQELISHGERQVSHTNEELAARPTSSGMRLRLRWVVDTDGPTGLIEARERLLRQTADAWSEEDRAAVGAFLQSRIQEVRSRDVTGTWIEHLTDALDYRTWHRFTVERHQAGGWRSATGPSSGGERVLAASVPLFAAASSYYGSAANTHAPRLVMLDEAFAGVDDSARAKCLGLLAAFDLDVVMTSEREWGCYREVPGLAIAQLSRVEDVAAVLVVHWEWNGVQLTQLERPVTPVGVVVAPANSESREGRRLWETSITGD